MADLSGPFGSMTNGTVVTVPANTVILQNGNNNNGTCLPCDEGAVCSVGQSNGSRLDLSKFKTTNNTLRFNIDTTGATGAAEDKNLVLFTPLYINTWDQFLRLVDYFGNSLLGGYNGIVYNDWDGSLINGKDAGKYLGSFNTSGLGGGALLAKATIQFNSATYPALDGISITGFMLPPDPRDSICADVVYTPLCDFCTSTNNGNFTTHAYQASLPISVRQGVVVFIPGATGGSKFTLDLCFAANGFPNHEQSTWADQESCC